MRFAGPGGDAELLGLSFADAGQHQEPGCYVDHAVPHCRSRRDVQGRAAGRGTRTRCGSATCGSGRRRVGTDTYELNRNLLLTDGARADSVPNLEIETGEIAGAGHASATGRFDDQQLFYLQARGIPEIEARRLVVRGFFADVIDAASACPSGCTTRSDGRAVEALSAESAQRAGRRGDVRAALTVAQCSTQLCALAEFPTASRVRVEFGDEPVCVVHTERRGVRDPRTSARTPRSPLSDGEVEGTTDRVLAARLALRPAHRQADRACRPTVPVPVYETKIEATTTVLVRLES